MGELLGTWRRSCMCAEVGQEQVGETVTVMGWVHRRRDLGQLMFLWLRDRTGMVQVVFDAGKDAELAQRASVIRGEYVLAVRGVVTARTPENINPALKTGTIEIEARELKILNEADTPPFHLDEDSVSENFRLKYRYYDLRRPTIQRILMMKHAVTRSVREYLDQAGFIDLETPILTKSTPEGARDYLVPSRIFPGEFFALPQSPQIFKQLLMVAGFDKYYQIAKCFRDEDLRADRQPEFQQIDIEMSFVGEEEVYAVAEGMYKKLFKDVLDVDLPTPWPRLPFREAMARYGSDKPDTRFGMEIVQVSDLVRDCGFSVFAGAVAQGGSVAAINAKGAAKKFTRKELDGLAEVVKTYKAKGLAYMLFDGENIRSTITKFLKPQEIEAIKARCGVEDGDALFFVADRTSVTQRALGQLRLELGKRLGLIDQSAWNFLWITEFPLLEYNEEEGRYTAQHHPFCSPLDEDIELLETAPEKVRCKSYDIVLNGVELASGSIRIHAEDVQEKVFKALGFTHEQAWERFGFMLGAFKYGAPPHGGIAPGLDRTVMMMAGTDSIRDVIPFPKIQSSACPMTDAPGPVDPKQLQELGIGILPKEEA